MPLDNSNTVPSGTAYYASIIADDEWGNALIKGKIEAYKAMLDGTSPYLPLPEWVIERVKNDLPIWEAELARRLSKPRRRATDDPAP
jgi:hypothetical protein